MGEKDEVHHVLLVSVPAQGHLNPMLELAKRLASKGLRVTLATTEVARQRILNPTIKTSANNGNQIRLEFFSDGLSLNFDRDTNLNYFVEQLERHGPGNLSKLIDDLTVSHGQKLSCIVNNMFVPWVADVAQEHGIPCAALWIQPSSLYSLYYRYYKGLNQFPTATDPEMAVHLPGLPLLKKEDLPTFILPSNQFGSIQKLISQFICSIEKVKWVLGSSFFELEKDVVESMEVLRPIRPVGPLVPSILQGKDDDSDCCLDMWKAEDGCLSWLDGKSPSSVVYVSFGSVTVPSERQMENIAWGLKNSKRSFLWVVKPPPSHSAASMVGVLPQGFLNETSEQGLVVPWCPQAKVLSHSAIGCFVTHCGWNSALDAITSGVPVLVWPQWTDQPTNAKLLVDVFQMGIRMSTDPDELVSQEKLERCIAEIFEGPRAAELKKRAIEWKEAAKVAVSDGGSSSQNLLLFVEEVIRQASKCSCA